MSGALSFAEIEGQHVELLPARTVLSSGGGGYGADGGPGGDGGYGGDGGHAFGGNGGDAKAVVADNYNVGLYNHGDVTQTNYANAEANGGDAYANGGYGGDGGYGGAGGGNTYTK